MAPRYLTDILLLLCLMWLTADATSNYEPKSKYKPLDKSMGVPWLKFARHYSSTKNEAPSPRQGVVDDVFDTGEINLSTLISFLALGVSTVAILSGLLSPLVQLFLQSLLTNTTGNTNTLASLLNPNLAGTTLPTLPAAVTGRRRRRSSQTNFVHDYGMVQKLPDVLSMLEEAFEVYRQLGTDCQENVMCGVINETGRSFSPMTKNFARLFRALKRTDYSLIALDPMNYGLNFISKLSSPDCP